ncbi:hypothetical protein VOLCADRAFT_95425 [Volvox carteri f. nagariensis]|uniref:Guanylate cyclase domain-containing protein n=1 Tax=Volvox carteri f. nagariensis TaxID=3068 RepID=D8U7F0_VOLCA|nr:uncharacterized protein VOLCADRAFT_95425 [Volvox carteri f. nagariensis]EFJ44288.1 hypothetical protein VOLCADRAFT_95425 [Volvox carteri f. nagariensis]|eukprot:XP_002954647.1 hypothetical protein VOLCADRAFT_95425 [Volvox carteri f. nagariensis]
MKGFPDQLLFACVALAAYLTPSTAFITNESIIINGGQLDACVKDLSRNVERTCGLTPNATDYAEAVAAAVRDFVATCLRLQVQPERAPRILVPQAPGILTMLQRHATEYESITGVRVILDPVDSLQVGQEARQELMSNLTDLSDGWVLDAGSTGLVAELQGFQSLNEYVSEDSDLAWTDVGLFFRQTAAMYDGQLADDPDPGPETATFPLLKVIGIPLDGDLLLLYYSTWGDLVTLARNMNGTDTDGDGHGDLYGICFDDSGPPPVGKAAFLLFAMAAPYLQYKGTSQGTFFDPETMAPLADNAAMAQAVRHYLALRALDPKEAEQGCGGGAGGDGDGEAPAFRRGCCLMTVDWGDEFKASAALLSTAATTTETEMNNGSVATVNGFTKPRQQLYDGRIALVNFAPYSAFGGWMGAVSRFAPPLYRRRVYDFFAFVAAPTNSWRDVLDASTDIDPYRISHVRDDGDDGEDFGRWLAAGYDRDATRDYLTAIREALGSENTVLDNRLQYVGEPYRLYYEYGLSNLTSKAAPDLTVESVLRNIQAQLTAAIARVVGGVAQLQNQYCKLIGCRVKPIDGGSGDIESSTTLWELLSEDVMGRAVEVHHDLIRTSLAKCSGQGDSFICAFHSASDAVRCATQIQLALLSAPWPPELLSCGALAAVAEVAVSPGLRCGEVAAMLSADSRAGGGGAGGGGLCSRLSNPSAGLHFPPLHLLQNQKHAGRYSNMQKQQETQQQQQQEHRMRLGKYPFGLRRPPGQTAAAGLLGDGTSIYAQTPLTPPPAVAASAVAGASGMSTQTATSGCGGAAAGDVTAASVLISQDVSPVPSGPLLGLTLKADDELHPEGMPARHLVNAGGSGGGGGSAYGCAGPGRWVRCCCYYQCGNGHAASAAHGSGSGVGGAGGHVSAGAGPAPPAPRLPPAPKRPRANLASSILRSFSSGLTTHHPDIAALSPPASALAPSPYSGYSGGGDGQRSTFVADCEAMSARPSGQLSTLLPSSTAIFDPQSLDGNVVCSVLDLLKQAWLGGTSTRLHGHHPPPSPGPVLTANPIQPSSHNMSARISASGSGASGGALAAGTSAAATAVADSPTCAAASSASASQSHTMTVSQLALPAPPLPNQLQLQLQLQLKPQESPHPPPSGSASPAPSVLRALIERRTRDGGGSCCEDAVPGGGNGGRITLYRGLRVRIGMASGLHSGTDLSYVPGEARVLLSSTTFAELRQEESLGARHKAAGGGGGSSRGNRHGSSSSHSTCRSSGSSQLLVIHMGQHELLEGEEVGLAPQQVYQAVASPLMGRLALLPPLKVRTTFAPGVLEAPVGAAAVAFSYTVGADSLMSWDANVARQALSLLEDTFAEEVMRVNAAGAGGYIAEASGGLLLTAFTDPTLAVSCCLAVMTALPGLSWPGALLGHALCEELTVAGLDETCQPVERVLFRGLRIKAGLDYGPVRAAVNAATGRLSYRGRVMNRAARIAGKATAGQSPYRQQQQRQQRPVAAISLGTVHLRGVPEPVELLVCRHAPPPIRVNTVTGLVVGEPEVLETGATEVEDGLGI